MAVYLLNCFYIIQITIKPFENFGDILERIEAQCDAQIDTLSSEQTNYFVASLNLGQIFTQIQESHMEPLSKVSGLSANRLKEFNVIFFKKNFSTQLFTYLGCEGFLTFGVA